MCALPIQRGKQPTGFGDRILLIVFPRTRGLERNRDKSASTTGKIFIFTPCLMKTRRETLQQVIDNSVFVVSCPHVRCMGTWHGCDEFAKGAIASSYRARHASWRFCVFFYAAAINQCVRRYVQEQLPLRAAQGRRGTDIVMDGEWVVQVSVQNDRVWLQLDVLRNDSENLFVILGKRGIRFIEKIYKNKNNSKRQTIK